MTVVHLFVLLGPKAARLVTDLRTSHDVSSTPNGI